MNVSDLEYSPFTTTRNYTGQSISTIQANALEQSKLGIKIEENIGYGFERDRQAGGGLQPDYRRAHDGCCSFVQNAGMSPSPDKPRTPTPAVAGRRSTAWPMAVLPAQRMERSPPGRKQSLSSKLCANTIQWRSPTRSRSWVIPGTWSGSGSTQAARWDNSVKYVYQYGPVHAGAMYSDGGEDTGTLGTAYGFNAGAAYKGFSIDGVYTRENNAVNLLGSENDPTIVTNALDATVTDNEAWSIMGKYVYEFGGGFKDEGPGSKLTFFAGYEHIDQSNGSLGIGDTAFTNGGYEIINTPGKPKPYYTTPKELQMEWAGARYEFGHGWSVTGAYYHVDQAAFEKYGTTCAAAEAGSGNATKNKACAGQYDQGSLLVDYAFNKHFDVYAGVTYAIVDGGLASGYQGTAACDGIGCTTGTKTSIDTAAFVTGLRLRF